MPPAFGATGGVIPGFCVVAEVAGVAGSAYGLYSAYDNFQQGNYATAALDATLGVGGLVGAYYGLYGKLSKLFGGSCFLGDTLIVMAGPPPSGAATAAFVAPDFGFDFDDRWLWTTGVLAAGFAGYAAADSKRRRREKRAAREAVFARLGEGDDELFDDVPPELVEAHRASAAWPSPLEWALAEMFGTLDARRPAEDFSAPVALAAPPATMRKSCPAATIRPIAREKTHMPIPRATLPMKPPNKPKRSRLGVAWLVGCLMLAALPAFGLFGSSPPAPDSTAPALWTKPIEDVELCDRTAGANPVAEDTHRNAPEPNPKTSRWLQLRMLKSDGSRLDADLLFPLDWLEANDARVGDTIYLRRPEMGAEGPAEILSILPCPPVPPGPGNLVTGVFEHRSNNVIELYLAGLSDPLGVTANHRFWSEDRQKFVPAGELKPGERVRPHQRGRATTVIKAIPLPGVHTVYNLQIHGEHVYEVSELGVLVHNSYGGSGPPKKTWPKTADEMDDLLGVPGVKIPDGPTTPGRNKTVWKPNQDTKITFEQHPYDTNAPDRHKNSHWHLDTPNNPHRRFVPGDPIPGM